MGVKRCFKGFQGFSKIVSRKLKSVFLAAMSSSRSDIVTQCIRSSVRQCVPFFSSGSLVHLECHKALKSVKETQW